MAYDVIHKNSTVAGTRPTASEIELGEIGINAADAELYVKDTSGNVHKFQNTTTGTADGVQFTQAGTGAVQRTVKSKLQDVISVKDFGAKGDGTDDTAAIQAAFSAAAALQKGCVYFPAGTYSVNQVLHHPVAVSLIGEGSGVTSIISSVSPAIESPAPGNGGLCVRGLTIRGNGVAYRAQKNRYIARISFENCYLDGGGTNGYGFWSEAEALEIEFKDSVITPVLKMFTTPGAEVINNCAIRNCRLNASGAVPTIENGRVLVINAVAASAVFKLDNTVVEVGNAYIKGITELVINGCWTGDALTLGSSDFMIDGCSRVSINGLQSESHNVKVLNSVDVNLHGSFAYSFSFAGSTHVQATGLTASVDIDPTSGVLPNANGLNKIWYEGTEYCTGSAARRVVTVHVPADAAPQTGLVWQRALAVPNKSGFVSKVWISFYPNAVGTNSSYATLRLSYADPGQSFFVNVNNQDSTWGILNLPQINNAYFNAGNTFYMSYVATGGYQLPAFTLGIEYEERGWLV